MTKSGRKTVQIIYPLWGPGRAFRATVDTACAGHNCHYIIQTGEWYTKHKPISAMYRRAFHPFCKQCIPFQEDMTSRTSLRLRMDLYEEYQQTDFYQQDCQAEREEHL